MLPAMPNIIIPDESDWKKPEKKHPTYPRDVETANRVQRELTLHIDAAVLPIFCGAEGYDPRLRGTGTLYKIADRHFLVTAAHLIEEGLVLFTARRGISDALIPLGRATYYGDPFDLAVFSLSSEDVQHLPGAQFLNAASIAFPVEACPDTYYIYGYPCEWETPYEKGRDGEIIPLVVTTTPYDGEVPDYVDYNPYIHVLIDTEKKDFRGADNSEFLLPRKLVGMSGSSIWNVNPKGKTWDTWTPDDAKIVAVQVSAFPNSTHAVSKGTRWMNVGRLLHEKFPELRPMIEMMLPK